MKKICIRLNKAYWDFQKEFYKGKKKLTQDELIKRELDGLNAYRKDNIRFTKSNNTKCDIITTEVEEDNVIKVVREILYFSRNRAFYNIRILDV